MSAAQNQSQGAFAHGAKVTASPVHGGLVPPHGGVVTPKHGEVYTTSFNPLSLFSGGEKGFLYDPSDLSSMTQDDLGVTPAAVNSPVGRITDKSGNGVNLVQATAAARPILRQSGALYWLEFDGVDDVMAVASAINSTGALTAVAAARNSTYVAFQRLYSLPAGGSSDFDNPLGFALLTRSGSAGYSSYRNAELGQQAFAVNTDGVLQSRFDGVNHTSRINGANGSTTASAGAFAIAGVRLGSDNTAFFNGRFYGGLLTTRVLTASEITGADTYFGAKCGVTL
jgi:hypothetical protein